MISNKEKAILREYNKLAKAMDKMQAGAQKKLSLRVTGGEEISEAEFRETGTPWFFSPEALHTIWLAAVNCYNNKKSRKHRTGKKR